MTTSNDRSTATTSAAVRALASRRWRFAILLTVLMIVTYFGFILLVAYAPGLLGTLLQPGLSIGIVLGVLVIVMVWAITFAYVRWANLRYDPALAALREQHR